MRLWRDASGLVGPVLRGLAGGDDQQQQHIAMGRWVVWMSVLVPRMFTTCLVPLVFEYRLDGWRYGRLFAHCTSWLSSDDGLGVWLLARRRWGFGELVRLRRAFDLLPEAESLFFACSKKSNQKKEHPGASPYGLVRVGRAFRQGFLPWRKGIDIHVDAPAGLIVRPSPTHRGPKVKSNGNVKSRRYAAFAPPPACRGRLGGGVILR
ncbi:hypothetical protein DVJ77_10305 [Dyella tabacisoli]|uniref:Uncharacterized protein n=1 Tax=Dyella tabacisoli TaxID=2282381 RepID=A0A369UM00_9GAMM|nr:hypothetical protein DVJ77_10305 [Dyella tabacisoli]